MWPIWQIQSIGNSYCVVVTDASINLANRDRSVIGLHYGSFVVRLIQAGVTKKARSQGFSIKAIVTKVFVWVIFYSPSPFLLPSVTRYTSIYTSGLIHRGMQRLERLYVYEIYKLTSGFYCCGLAWSWLLPAAPPLDAMYREILTFYILLAGTPSDGMIWALIRNGM